MSQDILARNIILLNCIEEISKELPKDCNFIVLKGAWLLLSQIADPSKRQMSDIDILVKHEQKQNFYCALSKCGFKKIPSSENTWFRENSKGPPSIIDLHFSIRAFKEDNLYSSCQKISDKIMSLSPEYNFLHIISHALLNHGHLGCKEISDLKGICFSEFKKKRLYKFIHKVLNLAVENKMGFLLSHAVETIYGIDFFQHYLSVREKLFYRFLRSTLSKERKTNEYIMELFYCPQSFIRRIFPDKQILIEKYSKASLLNYIRHIWEKILNFIKRQD